MSERRQQKSICFETSLSHFQWFKEEKNEFLESTATGDKTPVQHLTHETNHVGMVWEHSISLTTARGNLLDQTRTPVTRSDPLI
jgi:hypothetical protein